MSMDAATQERRARLWSPPNGIASSELTILSKPALRRKQNIYLRKIEIIERHIEAGRRFLAIEKSIDRLVFAAKHKSYEQAEKKKILEAEPALLDPAIKPPTIKRVVETVRLRFRLPMTAMVGRRRDQETVRARQIAMYLARELTLRSYDVIGTLLGDRDHTTVIHGCRRVEWYVGRGIEPWASEVASLYASLVRPTGEAP